jgi:signal transduction histidine kinase
MRGSLRFKLLLSHLGLIIMAMGVAGALLLTLLERYFLEATEESLAAQARITAQALIPGAMLAGPTVEVPSALANTLQQRQTGNLALQTDNLSAPSGAQGTSDIDLGYLTDTSLQLGAQLETRIRVLDRSGSVLVDSAAPSVAESLQADALVQQALLGRYASDEIHTAKARTMAVAMPVLIEDEVAAVVYLTQPLRDVTAVLRDLRRYWLWSTAASLLLSGVVALVFSQTITRPLHRLTTAASAVARGNFDEAVDLVAPAHRRPPTRAQDELGQLNRAFDDMTHRLRAARQTQTTFVANVSHELRTPLTSIKGTIETLRDGAVDDIRVRDRFLETVETETDRLIRLVNDLLVLTRADAEALNLSREPLDLAEVARATVARLQPQAQARQVTLETVPTPDLPLAWADRDRIAQVLINLLDNAIKFSRAGGRVTVQLAPEAGGDAVRVQVIDQGIGIAKADLQQIGQRFYRAEKSRVRARDRAQSGSGLGLSIAVALVEAHGGRLWIESQEGAGTTVSFTLPAA